MDKPADEAARQAPLNPALRREDDSSHGTLFEGTDPMTTVSVQDADEGSSWPLIWAVVGVLGVLVAAYLLL